MKISINNFNRFDIKAPDCGIKKNGKVIKIGINGYHGRWENLIGRILEIFRYTVAVKGEDGTYYFYCKSVENWLMRVDPNRTDVNSLRKDTQNPEWVANALSSISTVKQPPLLDFGRFRKSAGEVKEKDRPSLEGITILKSKITVVENESLYSTALACCFHTEESEQEIFQLIKDTRIKDDRKKECDKYGPRSQFEAKLSISNLLHACFII